MDWITGLDWWTGLLDQHLNWICLYHLTSSQSEELKVTCLYCKRWCYGLHPWSRLVRPLKVLSLGYFQASQHKTHFLTDYYMWYLVLFYAFIHPLCDMHEQTKCFAVQQSSPQSSPVTSYDHSRTFVKANWPLHVHLSSCRTAKQPPGLVSA